MKNMTMKTRKAMVAFLMATTMVSATAAPALAGEVTVNIKATGLKGNNSTTDYTIEQDKVTIADTGNVTAMDVLLQVAGEGQKETLTRVIDTEKNTTRTYYRQGLFEWYKSEYGNYISAIKLEGHNNGVNGKVFSDYGKAGTGTLAAGRGDYFKLDKLKETETKYMGLKTNGSWNNTVHFADYLSEKDYNNYSGWMCVIDGSTYNNGVDTVLSDGKNHTLTMDFSMMMGLDQGFDSYVENTDKEWVPVKAW